MRSRTPSAFRPRLWLVLAIAAGVAVQVYLAYLLLSRPLSAPPTHASSAAAPPLATPPPPAAAAAARGADAAAILGRWLTGSSLAAWYSARTPARAVAHTFARAPFATLRCAAGARRPTLHAAVLVDARIRPPAFPGGPLILEPAAPLGAVPPRTVAPLATKTVFTGEHVASAHTVYVATDYGPALAPEPEPGADDADDYAEDAGLVGDAALPPHPCAAEVDTLLTDAPAPDTAAHTRALEWVPVGAAQYAASTEAIRKLVEADALDTAPQGIAELLAEPAVAVVSPCLHVLAVAPGTLGSRAHGMVHFEWALGLALSLRHGVDVDVDGCVRYLVDVHGKVDTFTEHAARAAAETYIAAVHAHVFAGTPLAKRVHTKALTQSLAEWKAFDPAVSLIVPRLLVLPNSPLALARHALDLLHTMPSVVALPSSPPGAGSVAAFHDHDLFGRFKLRPSLAVLAGEVANMTRVFAGAWATAAGEHLDDLPFPPPPPPPVRSPVERTCDVVRVRLSPGTARGASTVRNVAHVVAELRTSVTIESPETAVDVDVLALDSLALSDRLTAFGRNGGVADVALFVHVAPDLWTAAFAEPRSIVVVVLPKGVAIDDVPRVGDAATLASLAGATTLVVPWPDLSSPLAVGGGDSRIVRTQGVDPDLPLEWVDIPPPLASAALQYAMHLWHQLHCATVVPEPFLDYKPAEFNGKY